MKITVVGLGYVGVVAAAGLAGTGHEVLAVDINEARVDALQHGVAPVFEPGLDERVQSGLQEGALRFILRDKVAEDLGDVALVAVGTPPLMDGAADLRQVNEVVSWIKSTRPRGLVIAMKSTVPPGTGLGIMHQDLVGTGIGYAANPEFLREGRAIKDWDDPDRIVIGVDDNDLWCAEAVERMYPSIGVPVMITGIASAEMIKYANNAFLATRISFINEIASFCEFLGASVDEVSEGLAMDPRTGARIHAGVGYGGSCLPKDVWALENLAQANGVNAGLLRAVIDINDRQRMLPLHELRRRFNGVLAGLKVGVLGLAFKPETGDVRDAPSWSLIRALVAEGVEITAFDPQAIGPARCSLPASVRFAGNVEEAAYQSQALILLTEWSEIVNADWAAVARRMAPPRFVFDGRNALDSTGMNALGFQYMGIGRPDPGRSVKSLL